jgi:hypothetical protein
LDVARKRYGLRPPPKSGRSHEAITFATPLKLRLLPTQAEQRVALLPFDELIEPTGVAVLGLVLIEKGQVVLVEDLEKFVPANFLEALLLFAEIDTKHASLPFCADNGWSSIS